MILAFGLFLSIAASYRIAYTKGETAGADGCRAAIASASALNLQESQERILHVQQKTQADEDAINADSPDGDGPLMPVLRNQLVRMRREASSHAIRDARPAARRP